MAASFIVNDVNPRSVNSFKELLAVMVLYLLLCVSNWSITCLMEGEGRLKDIAIALGYAMTPMIFCNTIGTIFSQFVAQDEGAFYTMIIGVGIAYSAFMMLVGIMTVHNFTLAKTLVTLFLTLVALLIIIFVMLLLVDLLNQVYSFFHSIYQELIFRG